MSDAALKYLDAHRDDAVARLRELLAIPSVSTDPNYTEHVRRAAGWVQQQLRACGLDAELIPTNGHPVVYGQTPDGVVPPDAPTVLFYGHYDVQPPDPLDKWESPPFEPTLRDGAIVARGASDDKGQVCCFLEALRAWHETAGAPPCRVKVVIEGEEECGSTSLPAMLERERDRLTADVVLVSDTSMWDADTPAITYALRGLVYFDVKLHGPSRDLHSGVYGGTLANPATLLARVLGRLFDDDNRITIPGFYDDVAPLTDQERERWGQLAFREEAFLGRVGATPFGEAGFETLERRWARPACDINGLYGGYMGEGAKTVIPTFAGAKVSFRIPANMDPAKVARQFEHWLRRHDVGGCRWELTNHGMASPVATPLDSPYMAAARRAVEAAAGTPPVLVREGATIPVVAEFKATLGIDTILIGFGLESDGIHSPNERFALDRFALGARTHARLLADLAAIDR